MDKATTITVAEAAAMFGVAPITIRRYIAAGKLTAFRVGPRLIRLDPDQVARELLGTPVEVAAAE
ncbi:MAG: excisionase family DNA-binding protein [Mycobacterium sp.]